MIKKTHKEKKTFQTVDKYDKFNFIRKKSNQNLILFIDCLNCSKWNEKKINHKNAYQK